MLLLYWVVGIMIGALVLAFCQVFRDYNYNEENFLRHWYLFTIFWPMGLCIFVLWVGLKTYRLIANIIHNR